MKQKNILNYNILVISLRTIFVNFFHLFCLACDCIGGGDTEVTAVGSVSGGGRYDGLVGMFDPKGVQVGEEGVRRAERQMCMSKSHGCSILLSGTMCGLQCRDRAHLLYHGSQGKGHKGIPFIPFIPRHSSSPHTL